MMGLSQMGSFDESSLSHYPEACCRRQLGELELVLFEKWGDHRLWISWCARRSAGQPDS
jgi:hypothetical protein